MAFSCSFRRRLQLNAGQACNDCPMKKTTALSLLGGSVTAAAKHLQCTRQAIHKWPTDRPLPRAVADRVLAARVRLRAELLRAQGEQLDPIEEDAVSL